MDTKVELPDFLQSQETFKEHLELHLGGQGNTEKGESFLAFALKVLPLLDSWSGFGAPIASDRRSHDGGVDFTAQAVQGDGLVLGQSKYRLSSRDDFDSVISKFQDYHAKLTQPKSPALPFREYVPTDRPFRFVIVTASKLDGVVSSYERSHLPSRAFYDGLKRSGNLLVLDCGDLFHQVQSIFRKSYIIPATVELRLAAPYIAMDGVYLSVVEARELSELYRVFGSSIFFENIRDFLGFGTDSAAGREGVNDEILATLKHDPTNMLARNNGVTFKATAVEPIGDRVLRLSDCGIVNGCQTTMCVVTAGPISDDAKVAVKIISATGDSWSIAKAANFQNSVRRIDLDLARYLRPQLVSRMATSAGFSLDGATSSPSSIRDALDAVHRQRVSFEEMRLMYLGFFSRNPNNLFGSNYTELRDDLLAAIYDGGHGDEVMGVLFRLLHALPKAVLETRERFSSRHYSSLFQRVFQDDNPKYRCFIALLSACVCIDDWLGDKSPNTEREVERGLAFMRKLDVLLTRSPARFNRVFQHCFAMLAEKVIEAAPESGNDSDILQRMYREISGSNFQNLFRRVLLHIQMDESLLPPSDDA